MSQQESNPTQSPAANSGDKAKRPVARADQASPKICREFLLTLGVYEADALCACLIIADEGLAEPQIRSHVRHRLNHYLNAETNCKEISSTSLASHRVQRAQQLLGRIVPMLGKEELLAVMFAVTEIARNPADINAGIRMIQYYNSPSANNHGE